MPLNYSKWDALEVSDDSDIEGHPNVDHKSLVRMRQRQIHEQRAERDIRIKQLDAEISLNQSLSQRIQEVYDRTSKEGIDWTEKWFGELDSKWKGKETPLNGPGGVQPSEEEMILALMRLIVPESIGREDAEGGKLDKEEKTKKFLVLLKDHKQKLGERSVQAKKELEEKELEKKGKITSDDMKVGWDSSHVNKGGTKQVVDSITSPPVHPDDEEPSASSHSHHHKKKKGKEVVVETINAPGLNAAAQGGEGAAVPVKHTTDEVNPPSGSQADSEPSGSNAPSSSASSSSDEELPVLTPSAKHFASFRTPKDSRDYVIFHKCISEDPLLIKEETTDALLAEAFNGGLDWAEGKEKEKKIAQGVEAEGGEKKKKKGKGKSEESKLSYVKQCVHRALMSQYCRKLGKDGVTLFFRRMTSPQNPQALKVFLDDVDSTYNRIISRAQVLASERASRPPGEDDEEAEGGEGGGRETIQLATTDPNTTITFNVPEGPPPEQLVLEGEGTEELDVEKVRAWLIRQWEIFDSFPKGLKKALKEGSLDKVNKVLGKMAVDEGEETVKLLDEAGILNFQSSEIQDHTGNS